ncbi:uncharacterized protein LOC110116933 [Athalia rosae]|uniref:uncharacterized protein LOC110116933 n=1 Tax=Athalia rosae TaxID=37344 RepID=UPI0020332B59|nr:uncharacterized protein LOC110116933 [Athalia rosae]XP_020707354.2 uncharacterized protein LOC110116933 [Athalia rosae]XP_020707355.2 uncharacterized protein LOC110116933 [Athalia rosae]XP_048506542.1 uncharacterized protein LOC110116933 [Athalia rosae]XP_048506543.1 uncharacterized protein LOC110116933 [Athalia rosae]XP_048506544.1 uncharacterized protein LOC110116933 [Athalia rosae]XP_048506545.1 uncharacterized protein LOC110116933 [Athalia rosae]XP_048506546.1 uncharacterized protein 
MTARYECPDHEIGVRDVRKRYQDTALVIFREQLNRPERQGNYVSFGPSRKTMEYSNNGNDVVVVKKIVKPPPTRARQTSLKPSEKCSII